jgi:16S rRNA (adenine(1408)-N(1))-methyltransferase
VVDLGTGDGRFVLTTAAAEPRTLVIGIDASADAMAEASGRAARSPQRGGLANALFVAAAAEALPPELAGIADLVAIQLPWGSLLRGALALEDGVARGIAGLVAPGGRVEILVAPATRDRLAPAVDVSERLANGLADDWGRLGLEVVEAAPATPDEIATTRSTWAKRLQLRAGDPDRTAHRIRLRRLSPDPR